MHLLKVTLRIVHALFHLNRLHHLLGLLAVSYLSFSFLPSFADLSDLRTQENVTTPAALFDSKQIRLFASASRCLFVLMETVSCWRGLVVYILLLCSVGATAFFMFCNCCRIDG